MIQDFDWNGVRVRHAPGLKPYEVLVDPNSAQILLGPALVWVNTLIPCLFDVRRQQLVDFPEYGLLTEALHAARAPKRPKTEK